jgi:ribonucleoside-diphosphate reductase beta chain
MLQYTPDLRVVSRWKPLHWDSFPARLYCKGKRLAWDPEAIDFRKDAHDWLTMSEAEQKIVLQMVAIFAEGEGAVTTHLTPLLLRVARQGEREEELYLTQFLSDEANHVEGFDRFLAAVAPNTDLYTLQTPSSRLLFDQELPATMANLLLDDSLEALAIASATYNMIMEGVVAETGYHTWRTMLGSRGLMPGMQKLVLHVSTDEARHIAFGLHLLGRLIRQNPQLLSVVRQRMKFLLTPALRMLQDLFQSFPPGSGFQLSPMNSIQFALRQFGFRMQALERTSAGVDIASALAQEICLTSDQTENDAHLELANSDLLITAIECENSLTNKAR